MPFTIEMLMTIAAVGALFIGAAEEAALVVFLFAVGEVLEGVAADRARASIRALADLVPKSALLEENGTTREAAAATLTIGQVILARPGDRIAADGEVVEGTSGVDQSPVTGESVPVTRGPGDPVFAGSINAEAVLRVRVTKAAEDNTISRIIALVEEAESARAPTSASSTASRAGTCRPSSAWRYSWRWRRRSSSAATGASGSTARWRFFSSAAPARSSSRSRPPSPPRSRRARGAAS
jgi:cation transport ATPase